MRPLEEPSDGPRAEGSLLRRFARSRWGKATLMGVLVFVAALAIDGQRRPQDQLGVRAALAGIELYQATLSRAFGGLGMRCRFEPTCSHYGHAAIRNRGLVPGSWLAAKRISRCGPWTPRGTVDPAPEPLP